MEENSATPSKQEDGGNSPPEELTKEKLIMKCKNLLTIAQKAKRARDEYIEKNKLILEDNEKLNTKVQKLDKDLVAAQEMLATFTEQKLKLCVSMDELKKDRKKLTEDLHSVLQVKDQLETENISLKRQYQRIIDENETLITQLGEAENRLKNAVAVKTDLSKLQANNESIKVLCSNVTQEKMQVEQQCSVLSERLAGLEREMEVWHGFVRSRFGVEASDAESWVRAVQSRLSRNDNEICKTEENNDARLKLAEETEKSNKINLELQQTLSTLSSSESERNDMLLELKKYEETNRLLRNELDSLNDDKDKLMNNLEDMRIETRQLIESSEKLSEEIEALKDEKSRVENQLSTGLEERNAMRTEINKLNQIIDDLNSELSCEKNKNEMTLSEFEKLKIDFNRSMETNNNLTEELDCLKEANEKSRDGSEADVKLLAEELENCRLSENRLKNDIKNMEGVLESVRGELKSTEELWKKSEHCGKELKILSQELEKSRRNEKALKENLKETEESLVNLKSRLENSEELLEKSRSGENSLKLELKRMSDLSESLKNKLEEMEIAGEKNHSRVTEEKDRLIDTLQTKLQDLQITFENNDDSLSKQLESLKFEKEELKCLVDTMKEEALEASDKLRRELTETKEQLTLSLSREKKIFDDFKINLNELQRNNEKITNDYNSIETYCNEKCLEVERVTQHLLDCEQKVELLENEACAAKKQLFDINELLNQASTLNAKYENELKENKNTLNELRQQNNKLNSELNNKIQLESSRDNLVKELELSNKRLVSFKEEITNKKEQILKLEEDLNKQKMFINEMTNKYETNVAESGEKVLKLESELVSCKENFEKQISDCNIECKELCGKLETTEAELNSKNEIVSKLEIELASSKEYYEKQISAITESKRDDAETSADVERLSADINQLKVELKEKTAELDDKIVLVTKLESALANSKEHYEKQLKEMFDCRSADEKALAELKEKYSVEIKNLEAKLIDQSSELSDKTRVLSKLEKELADTKENHEKQLLEICENRTADDKAVAELKEKYSLVESKLNDQSAELSSKTEVLSKLEKELANSKEIYEKQVKVVSEGYEKQLSEVRTESRDKTAGDVAKLRGEIGSLEAKLSETSEELVSCRRNWMGHLTIFKGAFLGLKHSYEDLKKSVGDLREFLSALSSLTPSNFQEKIDFCLDKALQANKQDLLAEMQHMNQALKQRGEVISKLQLSLSEVEHKYKKSSDECRELEKSLSDVALQLEDRDKQLKFKDVFIKDLESEISRVKDNNESMTDGDVMSCSTISKAEESSRLKDVEDSFEDKYSKMKLLAMKLKKRVNDLTAALEEERNKTGSERSELVEKVQSLTTAAKNAQKLQESFDSVMDELEAERKKSKALESSLQGCCTTQEQLRSDISRLQTDNNNIPSMKKHIQSLTLNLSNAKKEIASLQKEKEVEVIKYSELKKEKGKLDERVGELSSALEQARHQGRTNNLLQLEMNNYEKTIADLSGELGSEKERVVGLRHEVKAVQSVKSALEEQICLLENQIKIEQERNTTSNKQLSTTKESLSEVQSLLSEKTERCEVLEREVQEERAKYESLALQTTALTSQFSTRERELETQLNSFQRAVCSLESKVSSRDEEIGRCESELTRVQSEFDTYRTRAQSVLAKQRSETVSHAEREQTEQIDKLNHQNSILTSKLDSLMSELEMMKTESVTYAHEKERSVRRTEELSKLLQHKTAEVDKINSDFRNFKISTDTLKQCFKTELEEKEASYKQLIDKYKQQVEDLTYANRLLESQAECESSADRPPDDTQPLEAIHMPFQQREEGEGSESVPSPQLRKKSTNLVPLDVLLNTPYDSESRIGVLCDRISLLEKEVSSQEVRCRHLAGLLSEAERDSARNSQLNTLLKEEIRRLERSLQRQPHAANTEYLKNVIFKFVTLQNGDERSRLVPVLDTILKLSPEETNKLNAVARGEVGSGWSNYLPSWPSL